LPFVLSRVRTVRELFQNCHIIVHLATYFEILTNIIPVIRFNTRLFPPWIESKCKLRVLDRVCHAVAMVTSSVVPRTAVAEGKPCASNVTALCLCTLTAETITHLQLALRWRSPEVPPSFSAILLSRRRFCCGPTALVFAVRLTACTLAVIGKYTISTEGSLSTLRLTLNRHCRTRFWKLGAVGISARHWTWS
jgi:hypothetical protein